MNQKTWSGLQLVNWSALLINIIAIVNAVFGLTLNASQIAGTIISISALVVPLITTYLNHKEYAGSMTVLGKIK